VAEKTKLIEVALPLEVINRESAREKSIRHGHPSTLHLWWARRPLAAARAVLFAQLVDDPSAHPDQFPTEEAQKAERERLHKIIERLVVWENINDERLLAEARAEILKSTDGNPPPILDPFCGGGTIPLEAQRLGLEAHASDLNPVAVLITKALIEIPPKFRGQPPVWPGLAESETAGWPGARGLAADVRAYGQWMRDEAEKRIGHLYPKAQLPNGKEATVIAWIWARTVTCPNPACRINMPLVRSWWLGKKKGKEAYVLPHPPTGGTKNVTYTIGHAPTRAPTHGSMSGRTGTTCLACGTAISIDHVRDESVADRAGVDLIATVAEGNRQRIYLAPDQTQIKAAAVERPLDTVDGDIADNPRWFSPPAYGLRSFADLFTNRQLVALTTLSDLVAEARKKVHQDALTAGLPEGERLDNGGTGAAAYADTVATYLGFAVSRLADYGSSISTWMPDPKNEGIRNTFARQAIPMTWDFAEANPLSSASGNFWFMLRGIGRTVDLLSGSASTGFAMQGSAASQLRPGLLVSTDPPYYDNIGYSDLSDFFYVWLRRSLRPIYPALLSTMLVPKAEELVANPYRHGGKDGARDFFEEGFREVFLRSRETALPDFPITVYYAFKQSESTEEGDASSGWETLLEGMIRSGWSVTATWPLRSERSGRMISIGTNALASAIVLSLRPRPSNAPTQDRQGFIAAMKSELGAALHMLQAGGIAPVDLPQAAIGPGMAVFSRYSAVLEPDGSWMTVRSALARINEVLDEVLSEQEGDFDATTRFAIAWFRTHGYAEGKFGDADNIARARNTAVAALDRAGILTSRAGKVRLYRPSDLRDDYDVVADESVSAWEVLHHLIRITESEGVGAAGIFLVQAGGRVDGVVDVELIPELSHLLFRIAEDNKWTKDAISFNSLVTAWPDIVDASRATKPSGQQAALDFDGDE
jgi:putative DNA methylase